jgi:hypothetical protein
LPFDKVAADEVTPRHHLHICTHARYLTYLT